MALSQPLPPQPPDPVALLRQNPEAVAAVVAENAPALLRVARAWRVPDVDAEDLVQETFVTFLTSLIASRAAARPALG
ncbi:MAG: sigma factor, partial [Terriglobales bacterium]